MKLVDRINNLKVRNKLGLFLIIPVVTILFFSISGINLKYKELLDTRSTKNFTAVSLSLADLVHELQKERGLSAGFVGSNGTRFTDDVKFQRKFTDNKLNHFLQTLEQSKTEDNLWNLDEEFRHLTKELDKLPQVRMYIDALNRGNYFDYYSALNNSSLHIAQYLQVLTNDATLARYGNAFTTLLLLQERAGQERGALNGVFSSGQISTSELKTISRYIADQNSLLANFYTVAPGKYKAMLREKMSHPTAIEVEQFRAAAINKITKNDRLKSLQILIGYGGLIHDFKNYVLRGEPWYFDRFVQMHSDAQSILDKYQELPDISPEEIKYLNTIRKTFKKYNSLLHEVSEMRARGLAAQDIDPFVKVNDQPALEAIEFLHEHMTTLDTSHWWPKATFRLELIKQVTDEIRHQLSREVTRISEIAINSLATYLAITSISLLLSFLIGYQLTRRLVKELENISNNMHIMQQNKKFDTQLEVKGNDELGEMANAFNSLILERNKSEASLKLAALVFENVSEAVTVTDANNKIEMINPAFTQVTGYTKDEVIGKDPSILKSGKHDIIFYKKMWNLINTNGKWEGEIWNRKKNGDIFPEWLTINTIKNNNGQIIRHIAMFTDISKRKESEQKERQLQRQLLQAQKMESLGHLTGGIAHDFNNILGSILGYTELAIGADQPELKEKRHEYLDKVLQSSERAKELVSQMLAFSRGQKGSKLTETSLVDTVEESIKLLRPMLPSSIEIETSIGLDIPNILADSTKLHQIIMNLCINARDAMSGHGQLTLSVNPVTLNNDACTACHKMISGKFIELAIKDTGAGINPDYLPSLFDPFFSTKEMGKGTGMGLAIVHGIVHDHNGHIIVDSKVDTGSTFRLLFPLANLTGLTTEKTRAPENTLTGTSSSSPGNLNILVVDDEETLTAFLTDALEMLNNRVTSHTDAGLALQDFKEHADDFDLVITDQTMPKLTGAELSKEILAIRPDIPIILCSGYSDVINEKSASSIGIRKYLTKPVNLSVLKETIDQLFE